MSDEENSADQAAAGTGEAGTGEAGTETEGGPTGFALPSHADIRVAAEIHEQCQAALEATGDVRVDCEAVERIDAAVLQCIGSLAGSLHQGARRLELAGRTEPFDSAVSLLGFDTLLLGSSSEEEV